MIKSLKMAAVATAALGGVALAGGSASAMPIGLDQAASAPAVQVDNVRYVCGPYRCFYRPNYGYYVRPFYRYHPYGWRPYHRFWY